MAQQRSPAAKAQAEAPAPRMTGAEIIIKALQMARS